MLIGRDPDIFAVIAEPVREWNRNNDIYSIRRGSGVMQFSLLGELFPGGRLTTVKLTAALSELTENLRNIPVNDEIFYEQNIGAAAEMIFRLAYSGGGSEARRFSIAPEEFSEKGFGLFAVGCSDMRAVRIIASKICQGDHPEHTLHAYVSLPYIGEVIGGITAFLHSIAGIEDEPAVYTNKVMYVSKETAARIKKECADTFTAEIDGASVRSSGDWLNAVAKALRFPADGWFDDMISDLGWIKESAVAIFITNADKIPDSERLLGEFEKDVLRFWEYEVETVTVAGARRRFMVYCVE